MSFCRIIGFLLFIQIGLFSTTLAQKPYKMLSWNVYMLPSKTMSMHSNMKRAKKIVDQFLKNDYDIICVQELFDARVRKYFCKRLKEKYPYQIGYDDQSGWVRTNSGLYTFSKYPATKRGEIKYSECDISDCFADKGAIVVQVELDSNSLTIINTHLQAGRDSIQERIRTSQLNEIVAFYESVGEPADVVYCGDFNISEPEYYNNMIQTLDVYPVIWKNSNYSHPSADYAKNDQRKVFLDYVMRGSKSTFSIIVQVQDVESPWKRRGKNRVSLSDHRAVRSEITF